MRERLIALKTISVSLVQVSDSEFRVVKFSNSAQLSIGQSVSRADLARWVARPDVVVRVDGQESDVEANRLDLEEMAER